MTDSSAELPRSLNHTMIAAALAALQQLLLGGHVAIRDLWHDHGSGPGVTAGRAVEAMIFDAPAARDALLGGMVDITGPTEWQGNHNRYRDWHGYLLTMPLIVSERIDLVVPEAPVPAADPEPEPLVNPEPQPEPADPSACSCWATSPNGCPQHYIRDDVDPRPLVELLLDERWGPVRGPVAPIEVVGTPGQSVRDLVARFSTVQGVVVVPGEPVDDGSVKAAFARYARARAVHYFNDRPRYPTMAEARNAVRYWPGCDMLTDDDRELVAATLVEPSLNPEPPVEMGTSRRRFSLLPGGKRQRKASQASEVAI